MRSAAVVNRELKRGLRSLATIASTATWVGLFGTVQGINASFGPVNGSKNAILGMIFEGLSKALMPAAFGLVVAIVAMWFYKFLLTKVAAMDQEIDRESQHLIDLLAHVA